MDKEPRRLGKLSPKYNFVLNPYTDARFTRCPQCEAKTKLRKLPLFIHLDPRQPVVLNKTCRYCPACDLLIVHQDELESLLLQRFPDRDPETLSEHYLVIGTVERKVFHQSLKSPKTIPEMLAQLHDFKAVLRIEYRPAAWYPED